MAFNPDAMDAAAEVAKADLEQRLREQAERPGALVLGEWLRDHYKSAGYKRLCRFLIFEWLPSFEDG